MKILQLLRAVLREIFDEAAYERFCVQEKCGAHHISYARFLNQENVRHHKKIRCC